MTHFILDCDDVLLDWQGGFIEHCRQHGITLDPHGPQSWDLSQWMGKSSDVCRRWVEHFNESETFKNLQPRPGAREFVSRLRRAGHTCSVLTACGTATYIRSIRYQHLMTCFDQNNPNDLCSLPFTDIHFLPLGASKFEHLYKASQMSGDLVFVEDNFTHARSGVTNGIKSYCLRRSHNRRCEAENPTSEVIWVDDLSCIPIPHLVD